MGGIVSLRQARVRQTLQPSINMLTNIGEGFDLSGLSAESCLTLSLGLFGAEGGVSGVTHTFFSGTTPLSSFGPSAGLSWGFFPFLPGLFTHGLNLFAFFLLTLFTNNEAHSTKGDAPPRVFHKLGVIQSVEGLGFLLWLFVGLATSGRRGWGRRATGFGCGVGVCPFVTPAWEAEGEG